LAKAFQEGRTYEQMRADPYVSPNKMPRTKQTTDGCLPPLPIHLRSLRMKITVHLVQLVKICPSYDLVLGSEKLDEDIGCVGLADDGNYDQKNTTGVSLTCHQTTDPV
jgi:hypothetical protein